MALNLCTTRTLVRKTLIPTLCLAVAGCGGATDGDAVPEEIGHEQLAIGEIEIDTLAELRSMSTTGNYKLIANINASATQTPGNEFVPIGDMWSPFRGTFDGGNFTISGLKIAPSGPSTGMFGWTENAVISRVRLSGVSVTGTHQTGALVGVADATSITSSYVTGTVSGLAGYGPWYGVGMMVGTAYAGTTLSRVWARGTVNGPVLQSGGLVGGAFGAPASYTGNTNPVTITEVFTDVTINPTRVSGGGTIISGGVVGVVKHAHIENAHSTGTILGDYSGGVVGDVQLNTSGYNNTYVKAVLTHAVVTVIDVPNRAGSIGHYHPDGLFYCNDVYWNSTTDGGVARPDSAACQSGFTQTQHRRPNTSEPYYYPYVFGMAIWNPPGGSDGIWDLAIWNHNSSSQYSTLRNLPGNAQQPL
jgi:hypothetical protein